VALFEQHLINRITKATTRESTVPVHEGTARMNWLPKKKIPTCAHASSSCTFSATEPEEGQNQLNYSFFFFSSLTLSVRLHFQCMSAWSMNTACVSHILKITSQRQELTLKFHQLDSIRHDKLYRMPWKQAQRSRMHCPRHHSTGLQLAGQTRP